MLQEENIDYLHDLEAGKIFFKKVLIIKEKMDKLDFRKIRNLYSSKDTIERMKNQATDRQKFSTIHISLSLI